MANSNSKIVMWTLRLTAFYAQIQQNLPYKMIWQTGGSTKGRNLSLDDLGVNHSFRA